MIYFLCRHGAQDRGTRFLFRTTLNWGSGGDCPALEDVVDGGVGGMMMLAVVENGFDTANTDLTALTPSEWLSLA